VAETRPRLANVVGKGQFNLVGKGRLFRGQILRRFCFASRQPLEKSLTLTPQKPHLKQFPDFRKKIHKTKPALPNNFSLGPKGFFEVFEVFVFLKFS
jgi:hypothetical protein